MKVYSVIHEKGGNCKSTTCCNLASALHHMGRRVALIDVDPQASLAMMTEPMKYLSCRIALPPQVPELARSVEADFLFIDTPSRLAEETAAALGVSTHVLIAMTCEMASLQQLARTVEYSKRLAPSSPFQILLTRFDGRTRHSRDAEAAIRDDYAGLVMEARIPASVAVQDAQVAGQSVIDYAPHSPAALAYCEVARKLMEE